MLSSQLDEMNIKLPTDGSLAEVYSALSDRLRNSTLIFTNKGEALVPNTLPLVVKRFWVRFLRAKGHGVVILDHKGVREPYAEEVETPEKKQKAQMGNHSEPSY